MGRPRLYATSVERKAAWRRRHGMAVRPHYPSAAAKQAAYRARKRQAARDLAARECAAIQQALQTRARADQCWELYALIDDSEPGQDMPRQAQARRPPGLAAGASAHLLWGGRGARAPASPGAPAPGARQGHQGQPTWARRATRDADSAKGCAPLPPDKDRVGIL